MKEGKDWPLRLGEALVKLEATKCAPHWLVEAVRDSLDVADALAPSGKAEPHGSDFFYPH